MKINLVEMSSFNAWIDRMEETGFPGVHSDNSLILFFVSMDGKEIIHNGVSESIDGKFAFSLEKPGRRFYILEYLEE